jgi:putative spermidine/putrescine transport system ATP-binding protein/spermidine/putrescine transport system ATP-binding protein
MAHGYPDVVLDHVSKVFPDGTVAVDDFSLSVRKGEFVAFLGPSGCGKTTTLKMIGGFEEPTRGAITIAGQSVLGVPPERRNTGMVFQNYALFPHMNVSENIGYGLKLRGVPKAERQAKVQRLLDLLSLDDVADRPVDQLSGGQRQRVAVARSVAVEPDVLLLDEPLGALDANLRARMQRELKRIQKQLGITFVFVTHAQSEAMAMADTIVVMNAGRIEQIGSPVDIFGQPATRFTAQFVGNNNIIDGAIIASNGEPALQSDLGTFRLPSGEITDLRTNSANPVSLVIRADTVRFDTDELGAEYDSAATGTVIGEEIVGSVIDYTIQLTGDHVFHVEQHESLIERSPALNDTITIRWPSRDALLLRS